MQHSGNLSEMISRAKQAQEIYSTYSQTQVNKIFKAAALNANKNRIPLAKLAVKESGMGILEDKCIKNHFSSEYIYNKYKDDITCGEIERCTINGITRIAEPIGIIAGIVPVTNCTSTAIFKSLITLKTRNALILSPHPRACNSTIEAANTVYQAAREAGAPENIIQWIDSPSMKTSQALMQHPDINLILATGGNLMVKSAYSSGHPSIGVGSGNSPVIVDTTADIKMVVSSIILSKTFDNGLICASEQCVIVEDSIYEEVKKEFELRGAYFATTDEIPEIRNQLFIDSHINSAMVGQSVKVLAPQFGIPHASNHKLIICEIDRVGYDEPLSFEKLCPVLAMYKSSDFQESVSVARYLVDFAGPGHTSVLYTSPYNKQNIDTFTNAMKTVRILINTPASQGAIGDLYNFHLDPSLTLGCGTWGSTSVSANVTPKHLLNIKMVVERKENMLWLKVPPKIYFKAGCLEPALADIKHKQRCFIVTDNPLFEMGMTAQLTKILDNMNIKYTIFHQIQPDPTLKDVQNGLEQLKLFAPDVIIAIGGGSPMDAAKIMWLLYEHPETDFENLTTRFMDIRKRVYEVPRLGEKADMICIPTTSGTGSEVTPFSVITDEETGEKYPIADYSLTPTMAIIDPNLVLNMPKTLTAYGGLDALTHAIESYVSVCANDFTKSLSKEALTLLFKYLPRAYKNGANDIEAREKVHYAATIAGMAFANAFLGICHSMAHKLGAKYHIPHGLANAILITHVIKYNATDSPTKQAIFPQYKYPHAKKDYSEIAHLLEIQGQNYDEDVENLIQKIDELREHCGVPSTLEEVIGKDNTENYMKNIPILAEEAFDDQCTGANPRYPLIKDLEEILRNAWSGKTRDI